MKLGIHLPQYGRAASPDAIRRVASHAEHVGLADVWVSDHLVFPVGQEYPSAFLYDALATLAWVAGVTERIGLGTSVLVVPQYHPLELANHLASLDLLSGGRLTIGAGVGWSEAEFDALDQGFHDRGVRMDEAIDVMRRVWTEDPATFDGEHYSFGELRVLPQPDRRIPIWIGGTSRAAYMRAAARGDGFQAISIAPGDLAPILAEIRAARGDRADEPFTISYRTGWDPQGMDPAQIRDEWQAYAEVGVTHAVSAPWRTNADDWIRSIDLLVELVEPDLA